MTNRLIGAVLTAALSVPYVFTTTSKGWINVPDLVAGDLFGAGLSNNMVTPRLIDLVHRRQDVWQQTALEHALMPGALEHALGSALTESRRAVRFL